MHISELITQLKLFDPDMEVVIASNKWCFDNSEACKIDKIELGGRDGPDTEDFVWIICSD